VRDSSHVPTTVKADIPAAGIQHLVFESTAGEARIGVSPDDAIHVKLTLQQEETRLFGISLPRDATQHDVESASVGQDRKGDTLTLSASFPSHDDHYKDVKQEWTVQLPARLSVDATMNEGFMAINGVSGGVKTELKAGETVIHVPTGPVSAHMGAGRLHVISDAGQPREISVRSTFGLAILELQGTYYGPPEQRGGLHLFGNSVHQQSAGKDDFDLKTTAGLADLRIGPQGDEKEYRDLFVDDPDDKSDKKDEKQDAKKSDKDDGDD